MCKIVVSKQTVLIYLWFHRISLWEARYQFPIHQNNIWKFYIIFGQYKNRSTTISCELSMRSLCLQFSSVAQSCLKICNPMNRSMPGLPIHHQLLESTQTHAHWVGEAFQPSHPLSSPSPPALNLSQHQGLFKWVSFSHQVAKVLEIQLQHQSFQWTPRTDLL